MSTPIKTLAVLADQAVELYRKIQEIEKGKLEKLKEDLGTMKELLKIQMSREGKKRVTSSDGLGWVTWVDKNGARKLDTGKIAKALGISEEKLLADYSTLGIGSSHLMMGLAAEEVQKDDSF